jgi:hypothetical protein
VRPLRFTAWRFAVCGRSERSLPGFSLLRFSLAWAADFLAHSEDERLMMLVRFERITYGRFRTLTAIIGTLVGSFLLLRGSIRRPPSRFALGIVELDHH